MILARQRSNFLASWTMPRGYRWRRLVELLVGSWWENGKSCQVMRIGRDWGGELFGRGAFLRSRWVGILGMLDLTLTSREGMM